MLRHSAKILSVACTVSCGVNGNSRPQVGLSADLLLSLEEAVARPITPKELAGLDAITVSQYYIALLHSTTDDVFRVGAQEIGNAHTALLAAAPVFASLQRQYVWLGAMVRAATKGELTTTPQDLADDITGLGQAFRAGTGVFSARPDPQWEGAFRSDNQLKVAGTSPELHNIGALELVASLGTPEPASLALDDNSSCGNTGHKVALYYFQNPPGKGLNRQVLRTFGHASVAIQTAGVEGRDDFISFNGTPDFEAEKEAYGPYQEINFPEMTDEQAAAWASYAQSPCFQQLSDVSSYNVLSNNCAHAAVKALQACGYNLPVNANARFLTPRYLKSVAKRYVANQPGP